jgi:hypothetical protein
VGFLDWFACQEELWMGIRMGGKLAFDGVVRYILFKRRIDLGNIIRI